MAKTKTEGAPAVAQSPEEALQGAVATYLDACGCSDSEDAAGLVLRQLADVARHSTQFPEPVVRALMKLG